MLGPLQDYIRSLLRFARPTLPSTIALVAGAALLEGVSLLAILPFLELFSSAEPSALTQRVVDMLADLGIVTQAQQIMAILVGFLLLVILRSWLVWARTIRLQQLGMGYVDYIRIGIFETMARADWATIRNLKIHQGVHSISTDVQRLAAGTQRLLLVIVNAAILGAQLVAAFVISAKLALAILAIFLLTGLVAPYLWRRAKRLGELRTQRGRNMFDTLLSFLTVLKLAKIHRQETSYLTTFSDDVNSLREESLTFASHQAALSAWMQIGVAAIICAVVVVALFWLETGTLALAAILIILVRSNGPVLNLLQSAQHFANLLPAYTSLLELDESLKAQADRVVHEKGASNEDNTVPHGPSAIELSNISYRHEGQEKPLIDGLSLTIAPGQMVALRGASGAGKTTLLDLVTGLLEPEQGQVTIDGKPASDPALTARLAYAPQDPVLLDRSIRENLQWGVSAQSEEAMWAALEIAQARSFIEAMPAGLDARVGERGQSLSGGERQRICLARSLLRQPSLLILDEATSAIDQPTEAKIITALRELTGQMTIILVTHREIDENLLDGSYVLNAGAIDQA